jgi:hypothetical protein
MQQRDQPEVALHQAGVWVQRLQQRGDVGVHGGDGAGQGRGR